jgi:acetyltransferase-like isoleucine patch superfamily enzyme
MKLHSPWLKVRFWRHLVNRFRIFWRDLSNHYERAKTGSDWIANKGDVYVSDFRYLRRDPSSSIASGVRINTPVGPCEQETALYLGRSASLGSRTEFEIAPGNIASVGDYTNINPNCRFFGDVRIGRYCLLAPDIFISSGDHITKLHPTWLIKDQDRALREDPVLQKTTNSVVVIEDDCWIGRSVFIKRGTYIGKGAVIGANSVVTKDISPYSIHAGIPNRPIGKRIDFNPPPSIEAPDENHWPYFYSGFNMWRSEWLESLERGVLLAEHAFRIILRGGPFKELHLRGMRAHSAWGREFNVKCNGVPLGSLRLDKGRFSAVLSVDAGIWDGMDKMQMPSVLRDHNVLSFAPVRLPSDGHFTGISSAAIR